MDHLVQRAVNHLAAARNAVALTGAGISIESGIPPFRGKGGLWEKFDPMEVAHIDALVRDPARVWKVLVKDLKEIMDRAAPNDGHKGLAWLEQMGILKTVITQNIDGLHQMAGNTDVIEFHGNFAWLRCLKCDQRFKTVDIDLSVAPPKCPCGGIFRPECVFFGEMIPPIALTRSQEEASQCDVMLVVGTSALVQPAAYMPVIAHQSGATVIEINPEPTPLTGRVSKVFVRGKAGQVMNDILAEVSRLIESKKQ